MCARLLCRECWCRHETDLKRAEYAALGMLWTTEPSASGLLAASTVSDLSTTTAA